jgi:hypothetical protein
MRAAAIVLLLSGVAHAAAGDVSFSRDVAPTLVAECQTCHGAKKAKGGYRLSTFEELLKPGDSKSPPVVAGKPKESRLYRLITSPDPDERMPQSEHPLPAETVLAIERWIESGATFDGPDRAAPLESLLPKTVHPSAPKVYPRPVPVAALAFHPSGKELAAGGYHEITIWDATDGKLLARLGNVARQTHSLAYSPDGSFLAAASGTPGTVGEVKVFDARARAELRSLDRTADAFNAVAFAGDRLLAAGTDNALRGFDVASWDRAFRTEQHADWVTAVATDGRRIVTASRDKSARVLDAKSGGEVIATYNGHAEPIPSLALAGDTAFTGGRKVHAWSVADGKKIGEVAGGSGEALRLAATKDRLYSAWSDGRVLQHSIATRELVRELAPAGEAAYGLAVDAAGERVAAGDFGGRVRVWDKDGKPLLTFVAAPGR